jgi:hypothetical protein
LYADRKVSISVLHLFNKTPLDWYAKKQGTSETATYGSQYVAARTATKQIIDNHLSLRYLGVPVRESFMFGDNESVVNSSNIPAGELHNRHIALSWHIVRESIDAKILYFIHIPGAINPSDMLSKQTMLVGPVGMIQRFRGHPENCRFESTDLDATTCIVVLAG